MLLRDAFPKYIIKLVKAEEKLKRQRMQNLVENAISEYLYTHHCNSSVCVGCIRNCGLIRQLKQIKNGFCQYYTIKL